MQAATLITHVKRVSRFPVFLFRFLVFIGDAQEQETKGEAASRVVLPGVRVQTFTRGFS